MRTNLVATALITALLAAGCASASSSVNTLPFEAKSYPAEGVAACVKADDGTLQQGLSKIESIDESTVVFTLCAPDPAFLQKLSFVPFTIDDSGYLQSATADGSILDQPNGTGPFKLTGWAKEEQIVLGRNDKYWGEKAKAETLTFLFQGDSAARLLLLQSGAADGIDNVAESDYTSVSQDPDLKTYSRAALGSLFIGLNTSLAPFDDLRVRKAIALAIDSQRIVDNFFPTGSEKADYFTPCSVKYGCEGEPWYQKDLVAAKQLLADAGYPNGFEVTLSYRDTVRLSNPAPNEIAADVQAQLAEVGVKVKLEVLESATFYAETGAGRLPMFISGWVPDFLDTSNYLNLYFGNGAAPRFGEPVPAVGEALAQASVTYDSPERAAMFAQANNALRDAIIMVPLGHGASNLGFKSDVTGAHASPIADENFAVMDPGGRGKLVFVGSVEPASLFCADEGDNDAFRVCSQISEGLYGIKTGGTEPEPVLATGCTPSKDKLTWTCTIRKDVMFHNGASLDATDVVDSFVARWDCASPMHKGRTSVFQYWPFFSGFLNPESCTQPS